MDMWLWIGIYVLTCLFWGWVLFLGGADWLEGSVMAILSGHFNAIEWSAEGIRFFAFGMLFLETCWFVAGLIFPDARFATRG